MEEIGIHEARRLALARAGLLKPEWTGLPRRAKLPRCIVQDKHPVGVDAGRRKGLLARRRELPDGNRLARAGCIPPSLDRLARDRVQAHRHRQRQGQVDKGIGASAIPSRADVVLAAASW